MSIANGNDDRELRLDEAAAQYLELQATGQPINRREWLGQYPDLAEELGAFLSDLEQFKPADAPLLRDEPKLPHFDTIPGFGNSPVALDAAVHRVLGVRAPSQRYRLRQFLARGGMGEVWLAEDAHVGRLIAVKRIREPRSTDSMMEERFLSESQITGQLEHPSIVPLHDLGRNETGELYSVMKFVQGCSLKQRLESFHATQTREDWPHQVEFLRLLEAFVSICRAVDYAHSRGVLHRDIKPDNIMLGSYGEALLLDWGLAKALNQPADAVEENHALHRPSRPPGLAPVHLLTGSSAATQVGAIIGSPAYMPPEIAAGHSDVADEKTDIYLLGATLYEILTGKPPRAGGSVLELIDLAQATPPVPPRRIDRRIPKPLEAICLRAMAHQSAQRYDSASALADEIEHFLAGEPVAAFPEPVAVRIWRWCRRHRRQIQHAAVGFALVVLAWLGVLSHQHTRELEAREAARHQIAEFRRLADEAHFFAANTDAVSEHAPYFDPQHALQLGAAALNVADRWDVQASRLPLAEERSNVTSELYDLLLVLANLHQQSAPKADSQSHALAMIARAAKLHPLSRAGFEIRSRCWRQLGESDRADLDADAARNESTPLTAQDFFLEGEFWRQGGTRRTPETAADVDESDRADALGHAVAAYQQALRLDPKRYWAHFQLARCYLATRRGPEAVAGFGTCIALRPESPWAYSTRGLTWGLLGQFQEAEFDLTHALRLMPDFRLARLNRGLVYSLQRKDEAAEAELTAAVQPPEGTALVEAAFYRSQIRFQQGRLNDAARDCEMFLGQRPDFAPAHLLGAQIYFCRGEDSRGMESVDAALACGPPSTVHPDSDESRIARGRVLRKLAMGLDLASQQHVLRLALREFESVGGHDTGQEVTEIKDLFGLAAESIQAYTERLAVAPHDLATRKKRGWDYVTLQSYDLAAADFETILQQDPEDAEAHSGLGYVLARRGARAPSELEAAKAILYGAHGFLVLHNVACIYAELAETNPEQRTHYEDLAITMLQRAVMLVRQTASGVDERELLRTEPAFHDSLRRRPEFRQLLDSAAEP
jgi:serine/threonine protein kinase/tetratricopeptide (TPR) repeat protein